MENRLELNKRPVYELPDEVIVSRYDSYIYKKKGLRPNFEPDLCLNAWGDILGESLKKMSKSKEIWIKTDNKNLINFLKNINYYEYSPTSGTPYISPCLIKKIILEEFYEVKHGE